MYDFDELISRRDSGSLKWDKRPDLDPFWVADMDFTSPPAVISTLQDRVAQGVFGYPKPHAGLFDAIGNYLTKRIGFECQSEEWIVPLGGMVPALSLAAQAFAAGGEVMACTPVYPPFLGVARDAGAKTIKVPHIEVDGRWTFDWAAMDKAATKGKTKLMLLCNPQNPLGRCYTAEEIEQMAKFCQEREILLISDEIHCDLVLDEEKTPFYSVLKLPEALRETAIVLLSPSKTYNIAGLGFAYAVIPSDQVRAKFKGAFGHTQSEINCLAYFAAESAYRDGEEWRQALLAYLRTNRDTITEFVDKELPGVSIPSIEATYLAWMDCTDLKLNNPAEVLEKKVNLFISDGSFFGSPGCIRLNYGCPHSRVVQALEMIKAGFEL